MPDIERLEIIEFKVGPLQFALRSFDVKEILRLATGLTPIHRAPEHVMGVINLRGQVVTVVNLHNILGFPYPDGLRHPIIIVRHEGEHIGLFVCKIVLLADVFGEVV